MTLLARHAIFSAYCAAVALISTPVLQTLYVVARDEESVSHAIVIPIVTLVLIYQARTAVFRSVQWSGAGLAVVLAALVAVGAVRLGPVAAGASLRWGVIALAVAWAGGFLAVYGRGAFRAAAFPLAFLVFMVPIPAALLDPSVQFLKDASTELVAALFSLTGTPYHREAYVFSLSTFVIEVADECSGIRSSLALLLTSLLAGHSFLRSPVSKVLLVLAVVPITILKNAIRIVTLSLLAIHVDPAFLTGRLHRDGGIVFFLMALAILWPLLAVLSRRDAASAPLSRTPPAEARA
jgi:exosortase